MIKIIKGLLLISLIAKISAFLRDFFIVDRLSAGIQTDILLISISIVTVVTAVFNTQMRTTFVPLFSSDINNNFSYALKRFKYISILLISLIVFSTLFIAIFNQPIMNIIYEKDYSDTNILLTFSFLIALNGISLVLINFLQAALKFGTIEVSSLLGNLCIISFTYFDILNNTILSIIVGYILGAIIQVFISIVNFLALVKSKKKREFIAIKEEKSFFDVSREYINLSLPITFSSVLGQMNSLLEKFFAGKLEAGSVTAIYYATTVKNLPVNIFIVTITNVLYSFLGINKKKIKDNFEKQNIIVICLSFLCMFGLIIFGPYLINFLLRNSAKDVKLLSNEVLQISNITVLIWAIKDQFFKILYIKKNTKIPVVINTISIIVQSFFLWCFYEVFKGLAIPLASIISNVVGFAITIFYCMRINYKLSIYNIKLIIYSLPFLFITMYTIMEIGYLNFNIGNVSMLICSISVFSIFMIIYSLILKRNMVRK